MRKMEPQKQYYQKKIDENKSFYFLKIKENKYLCTGVTMNAYEDDTLGNFFYDSSNLIEISESKYQSLSLIKISESIINEVLNKSKSLPIKKVFIDQLDADKFAFSYLQKEIEKMEKNHLNEMICYELSRLNHTVDGRVMTLWCGQEIMAMAVIVRSSFNWSGVICSSFID